MSEDVNLPPLPELPIRPMEGWYADDLHDYAREYARLAVLQERERCAKLCDGYGESIEDVIDKFQRGKSVAAWELAAAIRNG